MEKYPKCPSYHGKADVLRKKRKVMTKKDIGNKNNSFENSFLEHLLSVGNMIMKAYRKIPNISPEVIEVRKPFWGGLYSRGAYIRRAFCVSVRVSRPQNSFIIYRCYRQKGVSLGQNHLYCAVKPI